MLPHIHLEHWKEDNFFHQQATTIHTLIPTRRFSHGKKSSNGIEYQIILVRVTIHDPGD
jgi:hypothetical protein